MEKLKILLVDDHLLVLEGIASLLQNIEYISIIGKVNSGEEAINFVNERKPDIILMDIVMSGMDGIETTRWIKELDDKIKIILLSSEVSDKYVSLAVKAGIDGYLPKNIDKPNLLEAIKKVNDGERYFSQPVTNIILESYYSQEMGLKKNNVNTELTKREFEILQNVASGKSNQEVADELFISIKTVETHKTNILSKLGLKNSIELVKYAIKNNIIEL